MAPGGGGLGRPRPRAAWTGSVGQPRWRAASSTRACGAWPCGSCPASRSSGHVRRAVSARKATSDSWLSTKSRLTGSPWPGTTIPSARSRSMPSVDGQSSGNESSKPGGAPCSTRSPAKTTPVSGTRATMSWSVWPRPRWRSSTTRPPRSSVADVSKVRSGGSRGVRPRASARSGTQRMTFSRWAGPCRRSASAQPACDQISHGRNAALPKAWSKWTWVFATTHGRRVSWRRSSISSRACPVVDRVSRTRTRSRPRTAADRLVEERVPPDVDVVRDLVPGVHGEARPRQPAWIELRPSSAFRAAATSLTTKLNWAWSPQRPMNRCP